MCFILWHVMDIIILLCHFTNAIKIEFYICVWFSVICIIIIIHHCLITFEDYISQLCIILPITCNAKKGWCIQTLLPLYWMYEKVLNRYIRFIYFGFPLHCLTYWRKVMRVENKWNNVFSRGLHDFEWLCVHTIPS